MRDRDLIILIGQLPGLEAAKKAIQDQIDEIYRRISRMNVQLPSPTTSSIEKTARPDPTFLGTDSIGRIIRKRTFSPETLEKKRELMKKARDARLAEIRQLRERQRQTEGGGGTQEDETAEAFHSGKNAE